MICYLFLFIQLPLLDSFSLPVTYVDVGFTDDFAYVHNDALLTSYFHTYNILLSFIFQLQLIFQPPNP